MLRLLRAYPRNNFSIPRQLSFPRSFCQVPQLKANLGSTTYATLIQAFEKIQQPKPALVAFEEMLQQGQVPSPSTRESMVKVYSQLSDPVAATKMFRELKDKKIPVSIDTYNLVLEDNAKNPTYVLKLFHEIEKNGLIPNIFTFRAVISAVRHDQDKAQELLRSMEVYDFLEYATDASAYNAMIQILGTLNQPKQALLLLDKMQVNGVQPTIDTYNLLLGQSGLQVFVTMQYKGVRPNLQTYEILLQLALEAKDTEAVSTYQQEMAGKGFVLSPQLFERVNKYLGQF